MPFLAYRAGILLAADGKQVEEYGLLSQRVIGVTVEQRGPFKCLLALLDTKYVAIEATFVRNL